MRGRKPSVKPGGFGDGPGFQVPTRPKSLMGKPVALAEWKRICVELNRRGLWDRSDLKVLELYCDAAQDHSDADKCLQEHGPLVPDKGGGTKSNPAERMKRNAEDRMAKYLSEMGMTAVSAARLGHAGDDDEDEFMKLIRDMKPTKEEK